MAPAVAPPAPEAPSIAPRTVPTVPAASTAHTLGPQPHAPIDIARLRRPKRHIRTTILTTTVVGLFIGLLATGGVLAWRAIDDNSAAESDTTMPTTAPVTTPASTIAGASPTAPPLQIAGADWQEFSHPPFTVRVPPSAVAETDQSGTTYTSDPDLLLVAVRPFAAAGSEEQFFRDTMANVTAAVDGTMGDIGKLNSLGTAYRSTILHGDGTWSHARALFLAGTMVLVLGQGGEEVPATVTVAWSGIVYGGVVATGA